MSEDTPAPDTRNEGAIKAGRDGQYIFPLARLHQIDAGGAYAPTQAVVVEGERVQVGLAFEKAGCGSDPHSHPNEQFNFILKGTFRVRIGDSEEMLAPAGSLVYIPANMVHSSKALPEEDAQFFVVKDLSHGIIGTAAKK